MAENMRITAAAPVTPDVEHAAIFTQGLVAAVAVNHGFMFTAYCADFIVSESYLVHD